MIKQSFLMLFCFICLNLPKHCSGQLTPSHLNTPRPVIEIQSKKSAEDILVQAKKIENNAPAQSEILARKVFLYAISTDEKLLQVQAQLQIASIFSITTKYTDAMKVGLRARELAEKLGAKRELAGYYEIEGKIRSNAGDFNQSLEDFFQALNYYDKLKDQSGRGSAFNSIGTVYFWQRDFKKATGYFIRALSISILIHDTILQARSINTMGAIKNARKDYYGALKDYTNAMILNQKSGQVLRVGSNLMNIGIIYMHLHRFKESREYYRKALAIFEQFENYSNIALCNLDLGYYHEAAGNQDSCFRAFRETYNMAKHYGFKGIELEALTKLSELYQAENVTDSAFKYSILKEKIKDSVEIEKSTTKLSIAELQYNYDKQHQDEKIMQQKKDFFTVAILLILLSLIVISFLIISRQRHKSKAISLENKTIALEKKNLSDELEFKNRELTMKVMNLLKRNEFIVDTSRQLLEFKTDLHPDILKEELVKVAKSLQGQTEKEPWEEFEVRFKEVHSGYYDRLLAQFPELTPNELKMCGLLRLNMTTKDISELTGQRPETIDMARFRLRKHLGINDPKINLVTFLSKI